MTKNIYLCLILFSMLIIYTTTFASLDKDSQIKDVSLEPTTKESSDNTTNNLTDVQQSDNQNEDIQDGSNDSKEDITEILSSSYFISPSPNQVLEAETNISFNAKDVSIVEFYVRRSGSLSSIYLGQAVKHGQLWGYLWQTENYPNGDYDLHAEIESKYGRYESEAVKVQISNYIPTETKSEDMAKEITEEKKGIENKIKVEKGTEKEKLTSEIKDDIFMSMETTENKQKSEVNQEVEDSIVSKVEDLDEKIMEIAITQDQLENQKTTKNKEEIGIKIAQLVEEKENIKKDIVEKSGEILEKNKVTDKTEDTKQNIAQRVENLDQFLSNKEAERQDKIKEIENKDSDNDEVPDLEEIRLGTDLLNPDTDGDGYLDGDEIKHGYNPLAPSPGDKIVFDDPRKEGEIKKEYEVIAVEAKTLKNGVFGVLLSGKGLPNSFVTIYVYSSLPIVVMAKTNTDGDWSYFLDKPLEDGEHKVYVAVTDNRGKISHKSEPIYFIQRAQAITYIAGSSIFDNNLLELERDKEKSLKMIYAFLGLSIIVFCASVALMIIGIRSSRKGLQ